MALAEKKENHTVIENEEKKTRYRYRVRPKYTAWTEDKNIIIRAALPGVKKEDIEMKALKDVFMLRAKRDQILYSLELNLHSEIVPDKTKAEYNEGLLTVTLVRYNPLDDAFDVPIL